MGRLWFYDMGRPWSTIRQTLTHHRSRPWQALFLRHGQAMFCDMGRPGGVCLIVKGKPFSPTWAGLVVYDMGGPCLYDMGYLYDKS